MRKKLQEIKQQQRKLMRDPLPQTGGTTDADALKAFINV
jgi:hypothetical protein